MNSKPANVSHDASRGHTVEHKRSPLWSYALAVLAAAIAAVVRLGLDPWLGDYQPFAFFYVAVLLVSWLGGTRPGIAAAALGLLLGIWVVIPPRHLPLISTIPALAQVITYVLVTGSLLTVLHAVGAAGRRAEQALNALRQQEAALRQSEERHRVAAEALRDLTALLEGLAQGTEDLIAAQDTAFRFTFFNAAYRAEFKRVFGTDITIGTSMLEALAHLPEERHRAQALWQRALNGESSLVTEQFGDPARDRQWFDIRFSPVRDAAGHVIGAGHIVRNVTGRRRTEEALAQSEAKFRAIFEQAAIGIGRVSFHDSRWGDVNEAFCQMLGYSPKEMHATPWTEITHPEDVNLDLAPFRRMAAGELESYSVEKRFIHKKGHAVWARLTLSLVRDREGRPDYEIAVIEDISKRKRAEEQLRRRNEHLQILHQAADDLLLGREPAELLRGLHSQIATSLGAEIFLFYETKEGNGHIGLRACGGLSGEETRKFELMRFGRAICAKPTEALKPIIATELQATAAPNRRFVRKLGFQSYLYYPLVVEGRLEGTLAFASRRRERFDTADLEFFETIARTLTEAMQRKRLAAELQRHATHLESLVQKRTAKLREALSELEQMSYSMVHDMRAPLRAMQSFATLLEDESVGDRRLNSDYIRRIRESANRLDQLITDALNYNKLVRQEFPIQPVELRKLLEGMLETYPGLQPAAADIQIEFGELVVLGNESLLTQCFGNLLSNAVKFVAPGSRPNVRIRSETRGQAIRIWVEDRGIGIPPDAQEKIFRMFQRMHGEHEYPGTGIGLTIVKKAVERVGGRVGLESERGKGSKFWVELQAPPKTHAAAQWTTTE